MRQAETETKFIEPLAMPAGDGGEAVIQHVISEMMGRMLPAGTAGAEAE